VTPFDFSGKIIISIQDYSQRQQTEIERVWWLDKGGIDWVIEQGPKDAIYDNDPIQMLKWIVEMYNKKLK
jgi:hypothetical protein